VSIIKEPNARLKINVFTFCTFTAAKNERRHSFIQRDEKKDFHERFHYYPLDHNNLIETNLTNQMFCLIDDRKQSLKTAEK
jgi:hypothetical protein